MVHPASWSAPRVADCTATLAGLARQVRAVPTPLAAAPAVPTVVLDIGHSGTEVTRLAADGTVLSCLTGPVGGARLDEAVLGWLRSRDDGPGQPTATGADHGAPVATAVRGPAGAGASSQLAEAQRIRERLSLLPAAETALPDLGRPVRIRAPDLDAVLAGPLGAAVDLLGAVGAGAGAEPVLLIGGVARAPLLAELLDAAGRTDVAVAARPDAAAVLGALRPAPSAAAVPGGRAPPGAPADSSTGGSARSWAGDSADATPTRSNFPPPRRRPLRAVLVILAAAALAMLLLALGLRFFPPSEAAAPPAGVLAQYGYRVDIPAGWVHTGGLPQRRRVLLTPAATPAGTEVIAVERTPLGYDSDAERARALAELRAEFDAAVASGSALSHYRTATHAGRAVVRYQQADIGGRSAVDWFVVWDADAQFSVGCRHHATGVGALRAACALVVGSVRRG